MSDKTNENTISKMCFSCGKSTNSENNHKLFRCSQCHGAFYCNRECQASHYAVHKSSCFKELDFENITKTFWETMLTSTSSLLCTYFGNRVIDSERYWFLKSQQSLDFYNQKKWYTSDLCVLDSKTNHMTDEEFFTFWSVGKCSVFTFAFSSLVSNLIASKNPKFSISFRGKKITKAFIVEVLIERKYEKQVHCYEDNLTSKSPQEWDCDRLAGDKHSLMAISCENDNSVFTVDTTHFQYGLKDMCSKIGYPMFVTEIKNILFESDLIGHVVPGLGEIFNIGFTDSTIANEEKVYTKSKNNYKLNHVLLTKDIIKKLLDKFGIKQ